MSQVTSKSQYNIYTTVPKLINEQLEGYNKIRKVFKIYDMKDE